MKIIDLLNKIANGEEVPKKIKYKEKIFIYCSSTRKYYNENIDLFLEFYSGELLNDEVEIIEEQEEIDIQSIEELDLESLDGLDGFTLTAIEEEAYGKVNKLVQAVKQLDKKMEEKKNGIK